MLEVWNYKTWTRELANQRPDEALYLFVTVCYCTVHGNHSHRFRLIGKKTDYKSGIQNFDAFNSEEWQYPVPYLYKLFILIILIHECGEFFKSHSYKESGRNRPSAKLLGWGLNDPSHKIISKGRKDLESERSKDGNTGKEKKTKTSGRQSELEQCGAGQPEHGFPCCRGMTSGRSETYSARRGRRTLIGFNVNILMSFFFLNF